MLTTKEVLLHSLALVALTAVTTLTSAAQVASDVTANNVLQSFSDYISRDADFFPVIPGKEWVRGGGATAVGRFMSNLVIGATLANSEAYVTFSSLGTSRGFCRLMDFYSECRNPWAGTGTDVQRPTSLDFTVVTRGATEANYAKYNDLQLYPFAAAPVALVHSVQNLTAPLILSRLLAAQIFRVCDLSNPVFCKPNDVRFWNDSRIKALNPGQEDALNAAGEIKVYVRQDSAGITSAVKRAFAIFDAAFATQVDPVNIDADSATWRSAAVKPIYGLLSLSAITRTESSAISYAPLDLARDLSLNIIGLVPSDLSNRSQAVFPDDNTTLRAILERGLDYGSDGTPTKRRTIEFNGATNDRAWPIVMGAYLAVRLNTLRANATCETRKELLKFAQTVFTPDSPRLRTVAENSGVVMMPRAALLDNLAHLEANLNCGTTLVSTSTNTAQMHQVEIAVPDGLETVFDILTNEFAVQAPTLKVSMSTLTADRRYVESFSNGTIQQARLSISPRLRSPTSSTIPQAQIPFVALPLVVRFNWCGSTATTMTNCTTPKIDLSSTLVAQMYSGAVQWWNDSRLAALNPGVTFPIARIRFILPPQGPWRDSIELAIQTASASLASFSFAALLSSDSEVVEYDATQTSLAFLQKDRFTIYLAPSTTDESIIDDEQTTVASVDNVFPSLDAVKATVTAGPGSNGAYRFVIPLDFVVPRTLDQCDTLKQSRDAGGFLGRIAVTEDSLTTVLLDLVRWLLNFSKQAPSVQIAELPVRKGAELNVQREDLVSRVLSSIHGFALYKQNTNTRIDFFRSLTCDDGSKVVVESEQLNIIPYPIIIAAGYVLPGISIVLFIFLSVWVHINRYRKVVRFASPCFLHQILVGATVCVCTIFPLSVQEYQFDRAVGHDPQELYWLDLSCAAVPWLYTVGYTTVFLALFIKTWRLVKIFDNPRMRKFARLRDKDLTTTVAVGLTFVIFLNMIWYVTDRLHWERVPVQLSSDRLTVVSSVGLCTVDGSPWVAVAPLLATTFAIMIIGLAMCYASRNLPSDFQESSWISLCLLLQLQSLLFAMPILAFTASNSMVTFIVKVVIVLVNSTGSVLLIFLPKLWALYGWGAVGSSSGAGSARPMDNSKEAGRPDSLRIYNNPSALEPKSSFRVGGRTLQRIPSKLDAAPGGRATRLSSLFEKSSSNNSSFVYHASRRNELKPNSSELKQLTANSLTDITSSVVDRAPPSKTPVQGSSSRQEQFFLSMLRNPDQRKRFRERLVQRKKEEGLDFFLAVLERDRETNLPKREYMSWEIMREFIAPSAPKQINLPSELYTKLISACFDRSKVVLLSDELFHRAVMLNMVELRLSPEIIDFMMDEETKAIQVRDDSPSENRVSSSSSS